MNQADPLAQLRDIHLPEPVSWWPPAPGWWLAAFVFLAIVCTLIFFLRRRWLKKRYRTVALKTLSLLKSQDTEKVGAVLEEISSVLRRVAIQAYGREAVAPLAGDAWLGFLDKTGRTSEFSRGPARVLGWELYRPTVDADVAQVLLIAEKWIRGHR